MARDWELDTSIEPQPFFPPWNRLEAEGYKERNFVNLHLLVAGDTIIFHGNHNAAHYLLQKKDENIVRIWRGTGRSNGLIGDFTKISVFDFNSREPSHNTGNYYPGIIIKDGYQGFATSISMPFFEEGPDGRIRKPRNCWLDTVKEIYVKENGNKV